MRTLWYDIKADLRSLRRNPGFVAMSVLALGIGIGANTAVFKSIEAVWIRPLPFDHTERIVEVFRGLREGPSDFVSAPLLLGWEKAKTLDAFAGYGLFPSGLNLETSSGPERVAGLPVSDQFFQVFGVPPELGRTFRPEDSKPEAPPVVVLSYRFWVSHFARNSMIVGSSIQMNQKLYTVIGVMPPRFRYPTIADMWILLPLSARDPANLYLAVARLRPGVSVEQASGEMSTLMRDVAKQLPPGVEVGISTVLIPLQLYLLGGTRSILTAVAWATLFAFLVACANFSNLLLGYLSTRQADLAIRASLGASRFRIVRQFLIPTLLLAFSGGLIGVVFAFETINLTAIFTTNIPQVPTGGISGSVLLFDFALTLIAAALGSVTVLAFLSRTHLNCAPQESSHRMSGSIGRSRLQRALVVCEMSVSLILLAGAGLFAYNLIRILRVNPGFAPDNVLTFQMSFSRSRCADPQQLVQFLANLQEHVQTVPGVDAVATVSSLPFEQGIDLPYSVPYSAVAGRTAYASGEAEFRVISGNYFSVLRIPVLNGRLLNATDMVNSEPVAVINESFAREIPDHQSLGHYVTVGQAMGPGWTDRAPRRIVGIVGDVRELGQDSPVPPLIYVPASQITAPVLASVVFCEIPTRVIIKTAGAPISFVPEVKHRVLQLDATQAIAEVKTMSEVVTAATQQQRLIGRLLAIFALGAIILAALGVYGVMTQYVVLRRGELAIRIALGARRRDIFNIVSVQGIALGIFGVAIGLALLIAGMHLLSAFVFGMKEYSTAIYVFSSATLIIIAFVSTLVPAARAARIDPAELLRVS